MKIQKSIGFVVVMLIVATAIVGCSNQKDEARSRAIKVGLLVLRTMDQNDALYPDMSSPEAFKAALQPALALEKTNDGSKDWDDTIFIHPSSGQPFVPNTNLSNVNFGKIDTPANVIMFYAPQPDADERLVGYADGRTEWVKESDWEIKKMAGFAR